MQLLSSGAKWFPACLDARVQDRLVDEVRNVARAAPPFAPVMPRTGKPFSVMMTNCGNLGWISDRAGYRYQKHHPETGKAWPPMPEILYDLWQKLTSHPHPPQACLVNFYDAKARMGLHVDNDEADRAAPVLSISLGDTALFRIGGLGRRDPTTSLKLGSGDVVILENKARFAYHGIDRIIPGRLPRIPVRFRQSFPRFRRINLTLRRVHPPS